jgi:hypothetical protein
VEGCVYLRTGLCRFFCMLEEDRDAAHLNYCALLPSVGYSCEKENSQSLLFQVEKRMSGSFQVRLRTM